MSETLQPDSSTTYPMQVAVGIDLIEVDRIAASLTRFGTRFLQRVYTEAEQAIIGTNVVRLAGRFAVKEACAKALGTGIDGPRWHEIECLRDTAGKPRLVLHGQALLVAQQAQWASIDVSISTTRHYCTAVVVALRQSTGE